MTSSEELTRALLDLEDRGQRAPCQGKRRDRWTSDDRDEREWAASVCVGLGCPLLQPCGVAGEERAELFVWGGVDLGVSASKRKAHPEHPVRPWKQRHECVNAAAASSPGGARSDGAERGQIPRRRFSAPNAPGRTGDPIEPPLPGGC